MKQVLNKKGAVTVAEIPAPLVSDREILVQVHYSCVSPGTELASLQQAKTSLWQQALTAPDKMRKIAKLLGMIQKIGVAQAVTKVERRLEAARPLGYSAAGIVLQTGAGIKHFKPGDRVACAGGGIAHHAEFIAVPENLAVKVPEGLPLEQAATVTLGSIALQGVRRAEPRLGETIAVIGLGILGQLSVQMLQANGCRVIGLDREQDRVDIALQLGLERGIKVEPGDGVEEVLQFSEGYGADAVIITAAAETSAIVNTAMRMCRKKGKVIIVGAVGLNLQREEFYAKELDVLISTSYGPGRYDERYEQQGVDYPYAYVRWTENRNMREYLRLVCADTLKIKPLIGKVYPLEQAVAAYAELKALERKPLSVLLEYHKDPELSRKVTITATPAARDKIKLGVIGTGSFARSVHLPNLQSLNSRYQIYALADISGSSASAVAKEYDAAYATTDYQEILKDPAIDLVLITTRHNHHARLAQEAAQAGKAVFVEKPMALNAEELEALVQVLENTKIPFMVGFNRRFSPYLQAIGQLTSKRLNPLVINYQMNAGYLPREHWVFSAEGGGRNIGEACHIYDLFNYLTGSAVEEICACAISPGTEAYGANDNFVATLKYADGSLCSLTYTALGSADMPKEVMRVYCDGKIINLTDYLKLEISGATAPLLSTPVPEKGLAQELTEYAAAIASGSGYPIPLWQLIQATRISFAVEEGIKG